MKENKNSKERIDEFVQIARGGKRKMNAKIPRLPELPPLKIDRKEIYPTSERFGLSEPEFCEAEAYADDPFHKSHINVAAKKPYGKGEVILSTLHTLNGCIGNNPVLDKFIVNLIEK